MNTSFSRLLERFPLYPLLIGLYPVWVLFEWNVRQMHAYAILRALLFSLAVIGLVWGLSLLLFRHFQRAALFGSLLLVIFFSYGHLYSLLETQTLLPVDLARHGILLPLSALLVVGGAVLIGRMGPALPGWTRALTLVGVVLVALPAFQVGRVYLEGAAPASAQTTHDTGWYQQGAALTPPAQPPDVYFIILDGYTRADVLQRMGFDNRQFLDKLEGFGFTVLSCARSNYDNTAESLSSILNMNYLKDLGVPDTLLDESMVFDYKADLITHSQVQANFERMGYTTIAFANKAPWASLTEVDQFYDRTTDENVLDRLETLRFYNLFLNTTAYRVALDGQKNSYFNLDVLPRPLLRWLDPKSSLFKDSRYKEYQQNVFTMEKLSEAVEIPGPKFVEAHLMDTHSSFLFNPDGSFKETADESETAYLQQVAYVNQKILEVIEKILRQSKTGPIIIIQGDHGHLEGDDKVKILNALYLPGAGGALNAQHTPVNTFRFIFDRYFGGSYGLLPDQSYNRQNPQNLLQTVDPACP